MARSDLNRETVLRLFLSSCAILVLTASAEAQSAFIRADANADGRVGMEDATGVLDYLFAAGGLPSPCLDAADANDDGQIDIGDGLTILNFLFKPSAPTPPAPFPDCGTDPTADTLSCLGPLSNCPAVGEVVVTELAGNPLGTYPHFEFVGAFNEGSSLSVAVDTARFPALAGLTGDLYLVDARSEIEWDSDQTLVEVRPNGPQSIQTVPGGLLDNTFIVAESAILPSDGGISLSRGYDLVLDVDRDGMLSAGDVIDGRSDEAGINVFGDLTQSGPLDTSAATVMVGGDPQRIFYPADIASFSEPRPLVVISHGGGHQFDWYDYLQEHLASYGYVSMSHDNDFLGFPAVPRVLEQTDAFLGALDVIEGGVLEGRVDTTRVVWIGHSLGGQTALRGVRFLTDGLYTPVHYSLDSLRLVCTIAASTFFGPADASPGRVPYHLLYGSADGDQSGAASFTGQPFRHHDRAGGFRHSTYIHGADHNDFNCCGFNDFAGPPATEIGRDESQKIARALYLLLLARYTEDETAGMDYFWRQWEVFRPLGVLSDTTVVHMYDEDPETAFVIDDFQAEPDPTLSSSGGRVTGTVSNLVEDFLDDGDSTYNWVPSDPMNGMSYAGPDDDSRGIVFDWESGSDAYLEFSIVDRDRDFTGYRYLSFRACQGTRHPLTTVALEDLSFEVRLRDTTGNTAAIRIDAYGGGIEEPYQRDFFSAGPGWQNEFETIRIRLEDFLSGGAGLDLTQIDSVRFEFGVAHGSPEGRVGLDDIELHTR